MKRGILKAGYTIVSLTHTVETKALPVNTSTPKAKLTVLTLKCMGQSGEREGYYQVIALLLNMDLK